MILQDRFCVSEARTPYGAPSQSVYRDSIQWCTMNTKQCGGIRQINDDLTGLFFFAFNRVSVIRDVVEHIMSSRNSVPDRRWFLVVDFILQ